MKLVELLHLPMVMPVGGSAAWRAYWRGVPEGAGVDGPAVHAPEETFDLVASGRAACLVPASMAVEGDRSAVRFVPVDGLAPSELAIVARDPLKPSVAAFRDAVRSLLSAGPRTRRR